MFKRFRQGILSNQRGSTLSTTIIVVAVLAFSITTVTSMTINLSGQTTTIIENVNDEALGKGLITQAINEFETYIVTGGTFEDYNNVEIPKVLTKLQVVVTDVTDDFPEFGEKNGSITKVYKFGYNMSDGNTIYKYGYISESGSQYGTFHPFDFSIGTEGDLFLNGGYYEETKIFANNIYSSGIAPWQELVLHGRYPGTFDKTNHITSGNMGTLPDFTADSVRNDPVSELYFLDDYQYCVTDCFQVDETDNDAPYIIDKDQYYDVQGSVVTDQGDIQSEKITGFFNFFSFDEYLDEMAGTIIPTDNRSISETITAENFEEVIRDNVGYIKYKRNGRVQSYPNTPYVDVSTDYHFDFDDNGMNIRHSIVYDNEAAGTEYLEIWDSLRFHDAFGEGMIVLGDLVINNGDDFTEDYRGTYIISGDLHIKGRNINLRRMTFIVLGEVYIELEEDYGLYTSDNKYELSIIAKDNIHITSNWLDYGTSNPATITGLFYTEESIVFNLVQSKLVLEGALFARASGESKNPTNYKDESGNQINGIIINSYRGYTSESWTSTWVEYDTWPYWRREYRKVINYIPSNHESANRFQLEAVPEKDYSKTFFNIPDFENVTVSEGDYTFETSEWKIE